ncbi:solute carrier family 25 member 44-like [Asterias rubens]|uniref:solute carrier family 25 member 44-like n=1 Tax=Asterias rubens TaxID=7604 RepID=UPI001454EE45|nr:solute carrier family 25 member 44-like [Asterias rubens]XP_033624953.1 solute carrier family 25 member 44-like [Asterias rubens]
MKNEERQIRIIEWDDLDKRKFYSLGFAMSLLIRVTIYPTTLIKTRLQVQTHNAMYSGTWDAFKKITKYEGMRGLYKGFFINTFTVLSGQVYITTYEVTRRACGENASNVTKSFVGGAAASLVAQSVTVPIDIVSQHIMMEGQSVSLERGRRKVTFKDAGKIASGIWNKSGPLGFYKGYTASIMTFMPNSALWWPFYHFYADELAKIFKGTFHLSVPALAIQAMSGPLASASAAILTNPMDIVRTRLQVTGGDSIAGSFKRLYKEDGIMGFKKGLSARLISTIPAGLVIAVSYETLKRLSLRPELAHTVQW